MFEFLLGVYITIAIIVGIILYFFEGLGGKGNSWFWSVVGVILCAAIWPIGILRLLR